MYKEYVKAIKDPTHALCVYERAVVQFSVNPALWIDYCLYAMKLGDTCLAVSKRALRNCPWSEGLWTTRMRILEHHKGTRYSSRKKYFIVIIVITTLVSFR